MPIPLLDVSLNQAQSSRPPFQKAAAATARRPRSWRSRRGARAWLAFALVYIDVITTRTGAAAYFTAYYGPIVRVEVVGDRFECPELPPADGPVRP